MNRTQIEQEVKNLEAQLEEKRKQLEAMPKRWRAEKDEWYYFLDSTFDVVYTSDSDEYRHSGRFNAFNYFQTKEEAEAMAEKTKLMFEMTARIKELNGGWVAEWYGNKAKFGVKLHTNICYIDSFSSHNPFIFGLSVQSKEHAEMLLKEFRERIERWY